MLDSFAVNETEPSTPKQTQLSLAAKFAWTALILATLSICYFSHLGALGFVGPDEPRYAWIARDMAETGDWVTPRLYGKPWFEKPPLLYWGAALCFKLFGVSEAAARLPSAISALLATFAMAWLAWRIYGAETARWLLLLLPTTVGMIGFSHAAGTDMPFSGMLTIAMVCAAVVLRLVPERGEDDPSPVDPNETVGSAVPAAPSPAVPSRQNRTLWLALVLFGFFLGLSVLAKGPAGIVLCGGPVFLWALATKRWRDAFRLLHPGAIVAFCATALPWYILCARRNPDFFRVFVIEHNFRRYLTPEFQHIQPFWFYVPIFLLSILPWAALLCWTAATTVWRARRSRHLSAPVVFFGTWIVFCVAFFSASQSKLPGYILPTIPPVGLILGRGFLTVADGRRRYFGAIQFSCGFIFSIFGGLLVGIRFHGARESEQVMQGLTAALEGLGGLSMLLGVPFLFSRLRKFQNACLILCVLSIIGSIPPAAAVLHDLEPVYGGQKELADQLASRQIPPDRTFTYQNVSRSTRFILNFYLHREIPDWTKNARAEAFVVSGSTNCPMLRDEGFNCEYVPLGTTVQHWTLLRVTHRNQ